MRIEVERIPGVVTDALVATIQERIKSHEQLMMSASEQFVDTLDESKRAVALESRGRVLAYKELIRLLTKG